MNQTYEEFKALIAGYDKVVIETVHRDIYHYAIVDNVDIFTVYVHCIEDRITHRYDHDVIDEALGFMFTQTMIDFMGCYAEREHSRFGAMYDSVFHARVTADMKRRVMIGINDHEKYDHLKAGCAEVRKLLD
jgi:hypothetical protein